MCSDSRSPPATSSLSFASIGAKFQKRGKSRSVSSQGLQNAEEYLQPRAETLRRSHYCPMDSAAKCSSKTCRKRFGWRDRKRNCCMCGEVFCRKCTKFQRKLSPNAEPDPLGTCRNVCEKCFHYSPKSGRYRDLKNEFLELRKSVRRQQKAADPVELATPLPSRQKSESKVEQVRVEVDRLVTGFAAQSNNIMGLVGTPNWQKSSHWVSDSKPSECFECQKKFRLTIRKINCRVCGQVFCTGCTKSQILLYCYKDSPARWAINGKEGGPTSKPHRFETLPICSHCCGELEALLLSSMEEPTPEEYSCLDETVTLQAELHSLQNKVEQLLPNYQRLVDTLDIEDSSPRSVTGDHPLQELAKAQADLSDTFTYMANRSQSLKALQVETDTQRKLLKHIMMATFNFYQEHMFLFKVTQVRLKEMMPIESLTWIEKFLNHQSMERVHLLIQQLSYELLSIQERYKCELEFAKYLAHADDAIEEEFRPFLTSQGESWDKHVEDIRRFVREAKDKRPYVKLQQDLPRDHTRLKAYIRYFTLTRTKSLLSKCLRELDAKTREEAFLVTKTSLATAGKHVTEELKAITGIV